MRRLTCIETGRYTKINTNANYVDVDDIIDHAANKLCRRDYPHDFVVVSEEKMWSEIMHSSGGLTEHTGEYLSFEIS